MTTFMRRLHLAEVRFGERVTVLVIVATSPWIEVNYCGRTRTAGHCSAYSEGQTLHLLQNHDLVACLAIIASIALPQSLLNS